MNNGRKKGQFYDFFALRSKNFALNAKNKHKKLFFAAEMQKNHKTGLFSLIDLSQNPLLFFLFFEGTNLSFTSYNIDISCI